MRRLNLGILGFSALLVLVSVLSLWSGPLDPLTWDRVQLATSSSLQVGPSASNLLLLVFLAACVAYTIGAERGDPQRFSALILIGALLELAAAVLTRRGALVLAQDYFFTELPAGIFGPALALALAGSLCGLLGLADLVRRRIARGAIVAVCVFYLPIPWSAWTYQMLVAPDLAQPQTRYEVAGVSAGPDEALAVVHGEALASAPGAYPSRSRGTSLAGDCIELVAQGDDEIVVVHGSLMSNSEYPRCLEDYVQVFPPSTGVWDGREYKVRKAPLVLRVARSVSTGAVLNVVEQARAAGLERFQFIVLHTEPSLEGILPVYSQSDFFGSNAGTPELRLFRPHPDAEDPSPVFRFRGLSSRNLEELLPRPPGLDPPLGQVMFDWERVLLRVDPSLDWQTTATALDALNCAVRVVFLERLGE